jgi:hypothetical protein
MFSPKILCTAALIALAIPAASFAQHPHGGPGRGGPVGHGGPAVRFGGGGEWHGGYRGGGGFIPGAVAGAVIGGAIATAPYGYYGGPGYYAPGYYAPGYYDDQYYDDQGPVVAAPGPVGDDAVAYCMQTYRSYDPRSGTYLGYDGMRHPCP